MPNEEKKVQETLVLKSDGTTQKLIQKSKASRTFSSQEKQSKQEKHEKIVKQTKIEKVEKVETSEKAGKIDNPNGTDMPKEPETQDSIDKPRLGRPLTIQEESILLPLLQGLLAANGSDILSISKHENTPSDEKETPASNKNSRSNSLAEKSEKSEFINILCDLFILD